MTTSPSRKLRVVPQSDYGNRPSAPSYLTEEERSEWAAIVGSLPASWFGRETHATLASLCRHICRARLLGEAIAKKQRRCLETEQGVLVLDKLLAMLERESRAITALARSCRLTQQSRMDRSVAGSQTARHRPSFYDTEEGYSDDYSKEE